MTVESGNLVAVHYIGKLDNGEIFGSSEGKEPIRFTIGSNQMPKPISDNMIGMTAGDKKTVTVMPKDGFGERQPELEQEVPRTALPGDVQVGEQLMAEKDGQQIPVWIRELHADRAVVDGNHPLAGLTLTFEIELVEILGSPDSEQEEQT